MLKLCVCLKHIVMSRTTTHITASVISFAQKSPMGLEPTTSGLEVRRAIHCATETPCFKIDVCQQNLVIPVSNFVPISNIKCHQA